MSEQAKIHSSCYLCEGAIEIPAALVNETIPCPHCGKQIKVFAPKKFSPPREAAMRSWNVKQAAVAGLAIIVLLVSLFNAPWEITYRPMDYNAKPQVMIVSGSVFAPPTPYISGEATGYRLLVAPMAFGWAGIVSITGLLLLILRTREQLLFAPESRQRIKQDLKIIGIAAAWILLPTIAIIAGALVYAEHKREQAAKLVQPAPRKELSEVLRTNRHNAFDDLLPTFEQATTSPPPWKDFRVDTCCDKARTAGIQCGHKCCMEARLAGMICRKCNP